MNVIYTGPKDKGDISSEFHARGEKGKRLRLAKGKPVEVPDDMAAAMIAGDGPYKGHNFVEAPPKDEDETSTADAATPTAQRKPGAANRS